jgi:nitroreductase
MLHHPVETREVNAVLRLPKPHLASRTSVPDALRARRTIREITGARPDAQLLSNLLFAACGVNRRRGPFGGHGITAASASNSQEIRIYVLVEEGAFLFDAKRHELAPVSGEDLRALALGPRQPPVSPDAPVQLVFVADIDRLEHTAGFDEPGLHDPEVQKSYYFVDAGLVAANVYLFAAAEGLACWFHNCDRAGLAKKLRLPKSQRVLFAQTVGYPARARRSMTERTLGASRAELERASAEMNRRI